MRGGVRRCYGHPQSDALTFVPKHIIHPPHFPSPALCEFHRTTSSVTMSRRMRHSQNLEPVVGHPASSDETVHRLSQNDPSIAGLILNVGDTSAKHSDWPEQVGRAISRSTHLRGLQINGGSTPCLFEDRWQSFFMCLFHNRSIEYLTVYFVNFRKIDIFHILAPFIERNANLRNMVVWSSKIRPMQSHLSFRLYRT